jgi:hypothetical protein
MTKLLEQAIASVQRLSDLEQDVAARFLLDFANDDSRHFQLTDDQVKEVELARQEVRAGEIATDAEMEDVWRRFRR